MTDFIHPEIAARAIDAAKAVGLDICGIDVVVRDISRPLEVQGGVVVEVNAGPGLRMSVCNAIDFGVGTAFALTDRHWANQLVRLEMRILY